MASQKNLTTPVEHLTQLIHEIHGQKVILDRDLARLYGVETKNLNKAVRRNLDRFPADFMFQITFEEAHACLGSRFQFGTLNRGKNISISPTPLPYTARSIPSRLLDPTSCITDRT